jgi:hypothetical protein
MLLNEEESSDTYRCSYIVEEKHVRNIDELL